MTKTIENIFSFLLLHATDIQNNIFYLDYPTWQKITHKEIEHYADDYISVWKGKLKDKKSNSNSPTVCLGILKKDIHYQLLDMIFFKILCILMKPFNPTSINTYNLDATISFENPTILQKAVNFLQKISINMTIYVKRNYTITIELGKPPVNAKKQVIFK